jgi:iron(III) transport system substrate-binding protein
VRRGNLRDHRLASLVDRMSRLAFMLVAAVLALIVAAGCGDDSDDQTGAAGESAASNGAAAEADWQQGGGSEWEEILEKARSEGEVVMDARPALAQSSFGEDFERDTGIKLTIAGAEGAARQTSTLQEALANKLSVDIAFGGLSELFEMKPQGLLNPIKDQLLLPASTDPSAWTTEGIKWIDKEGQFVLQGSSQKLTAWTAFNTDMIDPSEIASWEDLVDPKFKGKIASFDPTVPDVGQALAAAFVPAFGIDFVKKLYGEQDVTLSTNKRQLIDWVARGRFPIALGTDPADTRRFQEEGLPVQILNPPDGPQFLTGSPSTVKQPRNKDGSLGPNPNAATVFINWFTSQPGQVAYNKAAFDISLRSDVPIQPGVDEGIIPDEGRETIDTSSYEFYVEEQPGIAKQVTEALGG